MTDIVVSIGTDDYRKATCYTSNLNCPLACALKRMFPGKDIHVGGFEATIDGNEYAIPVGWGNFEGIDFLEINKNIWNAKRGEEVETYTLTLSRI